MLKSSTGLQIWSFRVVVWRGQKTMISARAARLILFDKYVKITETHVRFFFVCLTSMSEKKKDVSSRRSHSFQDDK